MSQITTDQIIVPRITKILQTEEGLFCAYDSDEVLLFVTEHQTIASLYFSLPEIFVAQIEKINELSARLNELTILVTDNGSSIVH